MRVLLISLLIFAAPVSARAAVCDSNLMIVLDRSCSMADAPNGQTVTAQNPSKWTIAGNVLQSMTTQYASKMRFGLIMFPPTGGNVNMCNQPGPVVVNVAPNTGAMINTAITGTQPTGPCYTNIDGGLAQVAQDPAYMATSPQPGRRGFVLLVTDGEQSGGACGGTGRNAMITQVVTDLFNHGYATYVVGFGGQVDPNALDMFATAGGVPLTGMAHRFYQADTAADLQAAINAIAGRIGGDEFSCAGTPCPDGRCFDQGAMCSNGVCVGGTAGSGGAGGASGGAGGASGGSGGASGGSSGAGATESGCGCLVGGRPATFTPLGLVLLLTLVVRRKRTR